MNPFDAVFAEAFAVRNGAETADISQCSMNMGGTAE
jgi:hypothetical protein